MTTRKFSKLATNAVRMVPVLLFTAGAAPLAAQQIIVTGNVNQPAPSPSTTNWNVNGALGIGHSGAGEMHISGGSTVASSGTNAVGYQKGSSGTVTVDGNGSTWTTTGNSSSNYFVVGMLGNGSMSITNGGAVYCEGLGPGYYYNHSYVGSEAGATGSVLVDGEGSIWSNSGNLYIGNTGNGSLTITDGGSVYNRHGIVGQFYTDSGGTLAYGVGAIIVDGAGSKWTNNGALTIGSLGEGSLDITNGGTVLSASGNLGAQVLNSYGLRGNGIVNVDGKNSTWTITDILDVGLDGDATLNITNGGNVSNTDSHIARYNGSTGAVTVDGKDSIWTNSGTMTVGDLGNGSLTVTNGGTVSNDNGVIGKWHNSNSTVDVNGKDSTWTNTSYLMVGEMGTGTLNVTNGGAASNTTAYLGYDYDGVGKVTVDGYGSTWTSDSLYVGVYGSGEMAVTDGGKVSSSSGVIAYDPNSTGKVTVEGAGSAWSNDGNLFVGYTGAGELHIKKSGIVDVAGSYIQNGNGWLELDIGNLGSCQVTVGENVFLDGILQLTLNGFLDADYYVLINNLGENDVFDNFSGILFDDMWITLTLMDDMNGGGSFVFNGVDYYISYAGDSATGSLYGGNDVILSTPGSGGPAVPEPASLSLLALGAAAMIARRRK